MLLTDGNVRIAEGPVCSRTPCTQPGPYGGAAFRCSAFVRRSARAMQDGVGLALLHFFQQLTGFQCGRRNNLDTAPFRLR